MDWTPKHLFYSIPGVAEREVFKGVDFWLRNSSGFRFSEAEKEQFAKCSKRSFLSEAVGGISGGGIAAFLCRPLKTISTSPVKIGAVFGASIVLGQLANLFVSTLCVQEFLDMKDAPLSSAFEETMRHSPWWNTILSKRYRFPEREAPATEAAPHL